MGLKITSRSDIQSNLPFVLVLSVPWMLGISVLIKTPQLSLAFVLAYFPLFLYWLRSFRVIFFDDYLIYSIGPFQKGKVKLTEITSVTYQKIIGSKRPVFGLRIEAGANSFSINTKPFSKPGITKISKTFVNILRADVVDSEVVDFANADFSKLGLSWQQRSQFLSRLAWIIFLAAVVRTLAHVMT